MTLTYLELMTTLIVEHGCVASINTYKEHITFRLKNSRRKEINHRLALKNAQASIYKVNLRSRSRHGKTFFIPEVKELLSVDLHDPDSLKAIRSWLETLR